MISTVNKHQENVDCWSLQYFIAAKRTSRILIQQGDEIKTLWIGDLQYWMDESYLTNIFSQTNELASAKVIRNKQTGQSESYGFIEFVSRAAAEKILQTYNGTPMPCTEQNFRLNWATLDSGEKRGDDSADYTIFVGDLASDVSDYTLQETFKVSYPSVKGAKVVTDRVTGRSKGYGSVKFSDEGEQIRAMTEMNGQFCSTRPMRIGPATNKKNIVGQPQSQGYVLYPFFSLKFVLYVLIFLIMYVELQAVKSASAKSSIY
ncbi:Polyadenylate-binding protein rbp45 [Ranunculus cassubicifolius]